MGGLSCPQSAFRQPFRFNSSLPLELRRPRKRGTVLPHFPQLLYCSPASLPLPLIEMSFRERLDQEFESRRKNNPRYSLRALAAFLDTDHSTLSQILRGTRPIPARSIRSWSRKLGLSQEEASLYIAAEHTPDAQTAERQNQLRHWTAEAMSVVGDPAHWHILRLSRTREFRPDCRWIAEQIGASVDDVNIALSRLLRLRLLQIKESGKWKDLTGMPDLTEKAFRKLALARVRELSAK